MSQIFSEIGAGLGEANAFVAKYLLGFALGTAAAPALEPFAQDLANTAWALDVNRVKPPIIYILAEGVAQGQVTDKAAREWAAQQGFSDSAFDALVSIANTGPALGYAYEAWRRDDLTDGEFTTALKRTGLEEQWFDALRKLKQQPIEPGAIATAVHRGIMQGDGLIVTPVPSGAGNIPRIPVSSIDPVTEAAWHGLNQERLRVLIADTGLPLSLGEMLRLLNMGKVTETDVKVSVAESNVRNEYMDAALELRRRLLTPHEYAEAELRGVKKPADAAAGAALSGMEPADYDTLFQILGRPLNVHQITQALAHGAKLGGTYAGVPEPYQDAIRRSAIRPEYAEMAYALRYTYPAPFVLRALTTAHDLTQQQSETILLYQGWEPTLAKQVSEKWYGGAGGKADPHVAKAETQLWTATHKSYVAEEIDDPTATTALEAAGVDPAAAPAVLALWQHERALIRAQLSAKEIAKAYSEGVVNPVTGVAWTQADALAALAARGYAADDARTLLEL